MINEQVVSEFFVGEEFGGERLLSAAHFGDEGPDSGLRRSFIEARHLRISDCDETLKLIIGVKKKSRRNLPLSLEARTV